MEVLRVLMGMGEIKGNVEQKMIEKMETVVVVAAWITPTLAWLDLRAPGKF